MAVGRSPAVSGRRRIRPNGPPTPSSRSPAQELSPLPPGTQIEARIDDDGFYGSWFEATVVDFEPASDRRCRPLYNVAYSHLVSTEDGPEPVAASHVRPRPPPPTSAPGSSSPPPGFRLHDIVEAFDGAGWWSGIIVDPVPVPVPDLADPGSSVVTVAFPITREVMPFAPHLVRRRRDYVGGEWVPSLSVIEVQPKRGARVYKAGEKVEVLMEREAYGESWFPATVAKAVDSLSYIVEYLDEQSGGKATEYLHFVYIRPAQYHHLRESKVQLRPGSAVEVHCDGAWSRGVVTRVVRDGCEYEVSVDGEVVEQLLTKAAEQLRPLCVWNGKHWTIPTETDDKGQHSSRQQYASQKRPISPADAASGDGEGLHRASVSETDTSLSASCKSLPSNHSLNPCSQLFEKNGLSRTLNTCDTLLIPEVRNQNITSSLTNQLTRERPSFVKTLCVKKGISKNRRETHSKAHQVQNQLKGNMNYSSKQFLFASIASPECQTTSAQTLQFTGGTSSGSDAEGVQFNQLAREEGTDLLDKELAATINMICEGNRNPVVCTDTADTQVTKSNCLTDTPLQSHDRLVPPDGNQVDEGSILQSFHNAGSSVYTSNNILLSTFSSSGCSMPSGLAFSQISGHQDLFVKRSPAWRLVDTDVFKKVPQQPHFHPLKEFSPALREGMALGLMVVFASSVEDIRKSSITDSTACFEEKIATLRLLEENGFNVQFLRCRLDKLLQIKSVHTNYLADKNQLKAQLLEKTASLSQIAERLEKKEQNIANLEEELERARREAQKIMEEKEREDKELSRLKAADSSFEEACGGAEQQFQSVLAELPHEANLMCDH